MGLDLYKAARQIDQMAADLRIGGHERSARLGRALRALGDPLRRPDRPPLDSDVLRDRVRAAAARRITWLVPEPPIQTEASLASAYPARPVPSDYTVIATDGSQIDVDRHGPAHCFLINIGGARIRYGAEPEAELFAQPHLFSSPEELAFRDPEDGLREQAIEGPLLGLKRTVMECQELARGLESSDPAMPAVGLLDGSLVLWELSGDRYADFVRAELLNRGLLAAMDFLRKLAQSQRIAFGSYISLPRATEVVNLLRVASCPHEGLERLGCDRICGKGGPGKKECNDVALGLMDRDLFEEVLEPGERSAIFHSQSPIVLRDYREHPVSFFYLHTGQEVARVEMPRWQTEDPDAVDLLHAALLDQCNKGMGYPVALQEAHERAVVTMADRRAFWTLVQSTMQSKGVDVGGSLKARSKRLRAV